MATILCTNNTTLIVKNYGRVPFYVDEIFKLQKDIIDCCRDHPGLTTLWNGEKVFSAAEIAKITGSPTDPFMRIWSFTPHQLDLFLGRFQIWKVPLFQLLMLFPRPPHGTTVELMSLFHLMGDPIDSIASLIFTSQVTQSRLRRLQPNGMDRKELEELALLITAFEEVGDEETVLALEEE